MKYPLAFERMVEALRKLPGVGTKSAERMAYQLLTYSPDDIAQFADAIVEAKQQLHPCEICGQWADQPTCEVCRDSARTSAIVCVVQSPKDAFALERARDYQGRYHVLHGVLSPMNGIGPEDLNLESLFIRIEREHIQEIIIATNPNVEGETTALYLAKRLSHYPVQVTRLAYGLPVGGNLDYADEFTLLKAIEGRRSVKL